MHATWKSLMFQQSDIPGFDKHFFSGSAMLPRLHLLSLCSGGLLLAFGLACDSENKALQDERSNAPLSMAEIRNMSYEGFDGLRDTIVLSGGVWEGPAYIEGSATRPRVMLSGDLRLEGDINGDGLPESVVFLTLSAGGSGELVYLCVVGRRDGFPANLATSLVGDRVQIRSGKILDSSILIDVVEAGPQDASCCPGQLVTYGWTYRATGTLERSILTAKPGRLGLDILEGREWVLRFWDRNEPAPDTPKVTLSYSEGRFAGSSGCNRYFASVVEGPHAGQITVGPVGSTQMACPERELAVEGRFLAYLGRVSGYGFEFTRLALTLRDSTGGRTMLFEKY